MFLEARKRGKKTFYYLVHSYRVGGSVKRLIRYLGENIPPKKLETLRKRAEDLLWKQVREVSTFDIGESDLKAYGEYEKSIHISHFNKDFNWDSFTKEFTYSTNAIEGSTVAFDKTKKLIDKKDFPKNPDELETLNVARAVEFIRKTKLPPSLPFIKKLHKICFDKTKPYAGKLRAVEVVIKDKLGNVVHAGAPHAQVSRLLEELFAWYKKNKQKHTPIFLAALLHNQFEHIHPFQDGNGRVGRLLLNYILLRHGYPPVNISLSDRKRYYSALRSFDKSGNVKPMIRLIVSSYKRK